VKLFLPASFIVLAAGACCCCGGDMEEMLQQEGLDLPSELSPSLPTVPSTGVRARETVRKGSTVTIVDIHSEDAYFSDKGSIIGKSCTLDEDSSFKDGEWHGGPVHCGSDSYYFYKAAYQVN
jgi:hypothetical protein